VCDNELQLTVDKWKKMTAYHNVGWQVAALIAQMPKNDEEVAPSSLDGFCSKPKTHHIIMIS
jgi:hypothetical protein